MSLVAAFIACWLVLGLDRGLGGALHIELGKLLIAPSIAVPVLAFICLNATPSAAVWVCLLMGVATDLTWSPGTVSGGPGVVLGPYAVGYVLASAFVLRSRGVVIKKNPLTLAVLSVMFMMISHTWITLVMGLRTNYDAVEWSFGAEWASRMASAGATGVVALAWWLVLTPLTGLFGFHQTLSRFGAGRSY